jgi:hypothetical protein
MKINPLEVEIFYVDWQTDGQTEGWKDAHTEIIKLIAAFKFFSKALKKYSRQEI